MTAFRVNEPNVVYETFGEEIVLVNLDTGKYYSISESGPAIWTDLIDGFGIDEIASRIHSRYIGNSDSIVASVAAFVDRLVSEKLLVEAADLAAMPRPQSVASNKSKVPFTSPVIENYEDMQDLLLLDPIHDVDSAGWPVAKKNTE